MPPCDGRVRQLSRKGWRNVRVHGSQDIEKTSFLISLFPENTSSRESWFHMVPLSHRSLAVGFRFAAAANPCWSTKCSCGRRMGLFAQPLSSQAGHERGWANNPRIKRSPIRIGEHMPAWSVMDLSSLQAAEQPFQYFNIYLFIDLLIMLSCLEPDDRGGEGKRASTAAGGRGTARDCGASCARISG
jgi:hypothetical protein